MINETIISMTHYYLYIKAGLRIDATTSFYKVAIGESEAQCRMLAWLQAFANEHGHFFVRMNPDALDFMAKCLESVNKDLFDVVTLIAAKLVGILRTGCEEPTSFQAELNKQRLLMAIDPNYYCYQTVKKQRIQPISRGSCSK